MNTNQKNPRYTGALFDTDHPPPSHPPFNFQISNRPDQSSQKPFTGSPSAHPSHTYIYLWVGAIESPQPLQSLLALSVTKASSFIDCYQLWCQSYATAQVVKGCGLDLSSRQPTTISLEPPYPSHTSTYQDHNLSLLIINDPHLEPSLVCIIRYCVFSEMDRREFISRNAHRHHWTRTADQTLATPARWYICGQHTLTENARML